MQAAYIHFWRLGRQTEFGHVSTINLNPTKLSKYWLKGMRFGVRIPSIHKRECLPGSTAEYFLISCIEAMMFVTEKCIYVIAYWGMILLSHLYRYKQGHWRQSNKAYVVFQTLLVFKFQLGICLIKQIWVTKRYSESMIFHIPNGTFDQG